MRDLSGAAGTYALWLRIDMLARISIGRLGVFNFPAGDYVYLGSAFGKGGLRSRVGRHLSTEKKLHWHIDYLRQHAVVIGCFYLDLQEKLECQWSQTLSCLPGAQVLIHRFGAQDCQNGCEAHLVYFQLALDETDLLRWLSEGNKPIQYLPMLPAE